MSESAVFRQKRVQMGIVTTQAIGTILVATASRNAEGEIDQSASYLLEIA